MITDRLTLFQPDDLPGTPLRVPAAGGDPGAFSAYLKASVSEVNDLQVQADQAVGLLTTGRQTDIHNTLISMEKAGLSFQLMMQVRNKIVAAYEEMSRMQV